MRVKPSSQPTLRDKLSRLTLIQAQKLLGPQGAHWLALGGKIEIDTATQVRLTEESCRIDFPEAGVGDGNVDSDKQLVRFGDQTDPLVNIQDDIGKAKAYQVRQMLLAIGKLKELKRER